MADKLDPTKKQAFDAAHTIGAMETVVTLQVLTLQNKYGLKKCKTKAGNEYYTVNGFWECYCAVPCTHSADTPKCTKCNTSQKDGQPAELELVLGDLVYLLDK